MKPRLPRAEKTWGSVARYTHIGITYALAVLVGYFGGSLIDKWLHTRLIFSLVGVFVMMGGGIYWMYLKLKAMEQEEESKPPKTHDK
jgi:F0F1-type ATP synthase assembly protein I